MEFDWARAIDRNRDDLIGIVTRLFVLAGIRTGLSVIALPRSLRIRILAMLRPAEFAARRLILMAACRLKFTLRPSSEHRARAPSSVILGLDPETSEAPSLLARTHSVKPETAADDRSGDSVLHHRGFRGLDGMGPRVKPEDDALCETPRPAVDAAPRAALPAFVLFDPWKRYGHPWLEDGEDDHAGAWPQIDLPPDDLIDARRLCRRIRTLERALQDVEGQAVRLARWRARSHLESCKPKRWSPMRPGLPPGWRKHPKTAVEEVVKECHSLALYAWDTS